MWRLVVVVHSKLKSSLSPSTQDYNIKDYELWLYIILSQYSENKTYIIIIIIIKDWGFQTLDLEYTYDVER